MATIWVELGNPEAVEVTEVGRPRSLGRHSTTRFQFPPSVDSAEALNLVTSLWPSQTAGDDRGKARPPVWVETNDKTLRGQLCKRFNIKLKDAKRPGDWDAD